MIRSAALLLTFATGFSGLVYEVTWQKYLATLLGSQSEATAAVLGIYLGGLAVGYALFGRLSRRWLARRPPPRLLVVYAVVEAAIGFYALVFPALFGVAQGVSALLPSDHDGLAFAADVALSALLIGPPTVLMGATIPILTQALPKVLSDATRMHALVYGFNTAGAFAGALAAGFWLVPALGLVRVLVAMACVNLVAASVFAAIGWRLRTAGDSAGRGAPLVGLGGLAAISLLVGFAMMTVQTVLIRVGGLALGASHFTFSTVVAVFVLCIALGSFVVSALDRIPSGVLVANLWALLGLLGLLYFGLEDAPYWAHALRALVRTQPEGFYAFHLLALLGVLVAIGPAIVLSGATLPLLFHALQRRVDDLGDAAGRLYSWNTLGSLLGALLGGYALLFWLDLDAVYRIALVAVAVAAAIATFLVLPAARSFASAPLAIAIAAIALLPEWSPVQLSSGLFRTRATSSMTFQGPDAFFASFVEEMESLDGGVEFYEDDPIASISVQSMRSADGQLHRNIVTNGKSDSAVPDDYLTTGLLALLPALFAGEAERAFVVGYGTGVTAGELAALDSMREVVVAEISPAVIRAAPYFDYANLGASTNPKVQIVRSDAYRALLRGEDSFDLITSEPSNPWVTGVEMLFSREFLEVARDRLTPDGVFAQWLQLYELDADTIEMVLHTYAEVFEHVSVWYGLSSDLILLGFRSPEGALDLERLVTRFARSDFSAGFGRCGISGLAELSAHELLPLGVLHATPLDAEVHTLLHPRLSDAAARAFFVGSGGDLPPMVGADATRVGRENSLARRLAQRSGGRLSTADRLALLEETCAYRVRECASLLAEWAIEEPDSTERQRFTAQRARRRSPSSGLLAALQGLYEAGPMPGDGGDPVAAAAEASRLFESYYHHAAPFSRERLAEIWKRCESEPSRREACRAGQAAAGLQSDPG